MIEGVQKPYTKKLILDGVGYRMKLKGKDVVLNVGFSHPSRSPFQKMSRPRSKRT
jgi:large subunit ribosomal protein L6